LEGWNVQESQQVLEWRREGVKDSIEKILKRRFPDEAPEELLLRLRGLDDSSELDRWLNASVKAESIAEFQVLMETPDS
jgi:hypothetical protein